MSGRKERWTPEDYMKVVHLIAEGVPLSEALGKDRPAKTAFFSRLREDGELSRAYDLALQMRAQVRIARIEGLVDKLETGKIDPQSAKVALDALRFLASKEDSRRYGDITRQEISGKDGAPLLVPQEKLSDFETARLLCHLIEKGNRAAPAIDAGELKAIAP